MSYDGKVCLMKNPQDMANTKEAFAKNPLVPKPGTTYQWMPMTDAREMTRSDPKRDKSLMIASVRPSASSPAC